MRKLAKKKITGQAWLTQSAFDDLAGGAMEDHMWHMQSCGMCKAMPSG
jgi:hypothetical protein